MSVSSSSSVSQLEENIENHIRNEFSDEESDNNIQNEEFEQHDTNTQQSPPPHNRRLDANHPLPLLINAVRQPIAASDGEDTVRESETLIPTPSPPSDGSLPRQDLPLPDQSDPQHPHDHHNTGHGFIVPTKNQDFTAVDFALCALSVVFFLADMATNAYVAQKFEDLKDSSSGTYKIYFWLTFVFITLSAFFTIVFEIVWYADEKQKYGHSLKWDQWIVRLIFIGFGFGPAFRYVELILYAYQQKRKAKDEAEKAQVVQKAMMMKEDADFLYMLEKFSESALHLVLQFYIIKTELINATTGVGAPEIMKIAISSLLMPFTVTCFLRSERQADVHANNVTNVGALVQYFSRFFIIGSQALVLAMFLSSYPFIFMLLTVLTWGLLTIWVFMQDTHFSIHTWLECVYRFLIAFIYLFNYVNVRTDPSYYRALCYYSLMFIERGLMICFWSQQELYQSWYRWPVLVAYFVCFIGGITIKIIYYECHHPTKKPTLDLTNSMTFRKLVKKTKKTKESPA